MAETTKQLKICSKCKEVKSFLMFNKDKRLKFGLSSACKQCNYKVTTRWRRNNLEHVSLLTKNWKIKNKDKVTVIEKRRRENPKNIFRKAFSDSKNRNLEFNLSFDQFLKYLNSPCFYCGSMKKGYGTNLDRIDNELGYIESNVLPCCCQCNKIRGDWLTVAETKIAMDAILNYRKELKQNERRRS